MLGKVPGGIGAACVVIAFLAVAAAPAAHAEAAPDVTWVRQFGTPDWDYGFTVATDGTGVYVGGRTLGDLGGPNLHEGVSDPYLRAYDADGNVRWTRQFSSQAVGDVDWIAADGTAVYAVGEVAGALPGQTAAGGFDAFLRKYDLAGNEAWTRQFGTSQGNEANGVATDATGIYVAGQTDDALTGQSGLGSSDAFLRKYDPDGNVLWTREFGGAAWDSAHGVAVDGSGVYVVGEVEGLPNRVAALWKYSPDGDPVWTQTLATTTGLILSHRLGVATVPGRVYIGGFVCGTLPNQTNFGGCDAFAWAWDTDGNELWGREFGTPNGTFGYGIAADDSGVIVSGHVRGAFPGEVSAGGTDAFLRKYDHLGNALWTHQFGTPADEQHGGVAIDASDVYVAGSTDGAFPGQTFAGRDDAFLAKLTIVIAASPCPLSQGFWKNHEDAWPVGSLTLGAEPYDQAQLLGLLRTPPKGDASLILAHQLIAAKLNVANGSDPAPIAANITQADAVLAAHPGALPYGVEASTQEGRAMTAVSEILDEYNNGRLTPACVPSPEDGSTDVWSPDGGPPVVGNRDVDHPGTGLVNPRDFGVGNAIGRGLPGGPIERALARLSSREGLAHPPRPGFGGA